MIYKATSFRLIRTSTVSMKLDSLKLTNSKLFNSLRMNNITREKVVKKAKHKKLNMMITMSSLRKIHKNKQVKICLDRLRKRNKIL
jgi:hypothetical protein